MEYEGYSLILVNFIFTLEFLLFGTIFDKTIFPRFLCRCSTTEDILEYLQDFVRARGSKETRGGTGKASEAVWVFDRPKVSVLYS